ncbi:MAG: hypothetical protein ACREOU_12775 [Candidatus Eiseniibacteriota bacterium]
MRDRGGTARRGVSTAVPLRFVVVLAGLLALAGCQPGPRERNSRSAPADIVIRYYEAIEDGRYRDAYDLWGRSGAGSGKTFEAFADGFRETANTSVEIVGPVQTEGAAGSIYAEVPVVVRATTIRGETQRFTGSYTLRRVNDVPGATAEQLRWHIESARLAR